MRRPWYFVLPEERDRPSGGNIYNQRLMQALPKIGQPVEVISDRAFVRAIEQDRDETYWVDTLLLSRIPKVFSMLPSNARSLLIVHHLKSLDPPTGFSALALLAKEKPLLEWFSGFLASSSFTRDYLRQQAFAQPVLVAEPGIDGQPASDRRNSTSIRALMVANLVERKGIFPWLRWLASNIGNEDPFSLTIVGRSDIEPDYARQCEELVHTHPLLNQCIFFEGSQPPDRVPYIYRQSNLFVSTARMETFGMALQEASSYRLPILTMQGGYSAQHVRPGKNGVVFAELSKLGDFFLTLVREPAKFATLYQQAQQHSPHYLSWPETARLLQEQFDQFFDYAP